MLNFILQIIGNALGLYIAAQYIQGVTFSGDIISLLIAGVVLGILNIIIRPVLKIFSAPIILLTLGLFIIIINFFILWLLQVFVKDIIIAGFWAYFWTLAILAGVNFVLHIIANKD